MSEIAIVINDLHIPFHDPHAVEIALQVAKDAKVGTIYINGDLMDFYNINAHGPNNPSVNTKLADEITSTKNWLVELRRRFPTQKIHFSFGNHEHRLERFILANASALYGIVTLPKLLMLKELNISWSPYNDRIKVLGSDVYIQHSPPSYGKTGAFTSLEKDVDCTTIYGCSHREQKAARTGKSGREYYCFFNGWLGSTRLTKEHKEVFSYIKGHDSWQQCFALVTVEKSIGYVEQVSIKNGRAVYGGYIYG